MPRARLDWIERIKAVEREHSAMRLAIDRLWDAAKVDTSLLGKGLILRDLANASNQLDGTYVIRLFAEFESALRLFWPRARNTDPPSRTRDVLDGVAATRRIFHSRLRHAHEVREYRNSLVHLRHETTIPMPVSVVREYLCLYLTSLPPIW